MRRFSRLFRWYGAGPLHLLTMIGCLALAGYAAADLLPGNPVGVAVWLVAAVVGHDLILMPLYTLADRSALAVFRHQSRLPAVPWINYLRVPVVLSGLLLLIWFPLIFRLPKRFTYTTTLSLDPYLWHWLAVTGTLFLLSATAYAVRLRSARRPPSTRGKHGAGQGKHGASQGKQGKPPASEHPPSENDPRESAPRGGPQEGGPRQGGPGEGAPREGGPREGGLGEGGLGEGGQRESGQSEADPRQGGSRQGGPGAGGPGAGGPGAGGPNAGGQRADGPGEGGPRQGGPDESTPRQSGPPWDLPS